MTPMAAPTSGPTSSPIRGSSSQAIATPQPARVTIGELEAGYSMYCKALRLLIREGRTLGKIQRTVCWQRLAQLHECLPSQYKDPDYLYVLLRRQDRDQPLPGNGR
jgi:hypothetical protein